eukprot:gene12897-3774_t
MSHTVRFPISKEDMAWLVLRPIFGRLSEFCSKYTQRIRLSSRHEKRADAPFGVKALCRHPHFTLA